MATVGRRTLLVNGKRRNRKRRNRAKRKMSIKQIRIFGTKAQKAALKRRKTRRNRPKIKASRPRTRPRTAPRKRRRARKNVASIITASLPLAGLNPHRKHKKARPNRKRKGTMARPRKRKKSAGHKRSYARRRPARMNPRRRRRNTRHHHRSYRRNPSMSGITQLFIDAGWTAVGGVGSRTLTQFALGSSNTGIMGYGANLLSGLLISWGVRSFLKNGSAGNYVIIGTLLGIIFRAVQDFTPFGQYASLSGLGDFMTTTFWSPRGFVNSGKSGETWQANQVKQIAAAAAASAAATSVPAAKRGMGNFYGRSMYR